MTWLGPEFGKYAVFLAYGMLTVMWGVFLGILAQPIRFWYLRRRFH